MVLRFYRNGPKTSLASPCTGADTSITVASVANLPTQFPYGLILDLDQPTEEFVDVTNASGTILTVTRGVDSTTAQAHTAGAVTAHGVAARDHREANAHINGTTNQHGITGSFVDTDSVQNILGRKVFTDAETVAGGDVVAVGGSQTVTGSKNFTGPLLVDSVTISGAWTTYVPTWKDSPGGTNLSIGSGTLAGRFMRIGKIVHFRISLIRAADTNTGTAAGYAFGVPVPMASFRNAGSAWLYDDSQAKFFARAWNGVNANEIVVHDDAGNRVSGTSPIVWATSDEIFISGTYEAA